MSSSQSIKTIDLILIVLIFLLLATLYTSISTTTTEVSAPLTNPVPTRITASHPTKKAVDVKRAYDVEGEYLRFYVKVENHTDLVITGVKVWLDYPEDKIDLEKPKNATQRIGTLNAGEKKSVKYYLKPKACIETSIEGKVFYRDVHGKRKELDIKAKDIVNVCPRLKEVDMNWEEYQGLWYSADLASTKDTKSYAVSLHTAMQVIKTSLSNMTLIDEVGTESFWHAMFAAQEKKSDKHVIADIQIAGSGTESSVTIEVKTENPYARAGFIMNVVESITLQMRKMEVFSKEN